ncbi:type IV secretion system protein TraC, partial [Diaphorobacter sp. DS2]
MLVTLKKKLDDAVIPETIRADSIIPVLCADEDSNLFLQDDMTVGFGFFCDPLCGGDEKIQERVNGFLNQDLPTRMIMQFILYRSPDINREVNQMLGMRDSFRHPLLSPVIRERTNFLERHTAEKIISKSQRGIYDCGLIHDLKLLVTCKMPIGSNQPTPDEQIEARQLQTKIESSLQTVGLRPTAMTVPSYKRFMGTLLNWGDMPSWRNAQSDWEMDKTIGSQIFDYDCDLQISEDKLQLGNTHVKVLSAKKLPESMFFGDAITYVGDLSGAGMSIKENYMVVMNVFFPEIESTKNNIERKRQFTVNQAYGPLLKFVPVLAEKKTSFDTIYESIGEGAKPVRATYSVVIFAPTAERATAASIAARSIWRESRFELMEDKFITLPVFINCLPLCADKEVIRDIYRYKTMTTKQLAVLIPLFGEWKGTGSFHAALISRNGQLMSLSLHDSDTNKNAVIAAESGSGKSFLTNELIFSYLSEGAQVWVIDAGKSYQKLAEMLGGDFIHFEDGANVCLNPFERIENYEDEEDALVSFVCAMASAKGGMDEWQVAALKRVMSDLWATKGQAMQVDDIALACLQGEDPRQRDIGHQLYAFTSAGNYGKYFVGKSSVDFKNQFTVLELDELQGRKHLRQVVLRIPLM